MDKGRGMMLSMSEESLCAEMMGLFPTSLKKKKDKLMPHYT